MTKSQAASMRTARLYTTAQLAIGETVTLRAEQGHYLDHVLRRAPGDAVRLFNGRDGEWGARIDHLRKGRATVVLGDQLRPQRDEPGPWLVFAPLKKQRLDLVIEKAVELGVARLVPVVTRRCVTGRLRTARLEAQIIEAAEQCERLSVPELAPLRTFDGFLDGWQGTRRLLYGDETGAGAPLADVLARAPAIGAAEYALVIGPEGGFDEGELDRLGQLAFSCAVGLGPRILRAETAALAGLACLQALRGDWQRKPREGHAGESELREGPSV